MKNENNSTDLEVGKLLLQYRKMPHSTLNLLPSFLMLGERQDLDWI